MLIRPTPQISENDVSGKLYDLLKDRTQPATLPYIQNGLFNVTQFLIDNNQCQYTNRDFFCDLGTHP